MNCPNCNTQAKPDMTFCGKCGNSLTNLSKETSPMRPSNMVNDPEELEKIFTDLVSYSWERYDEILINKSLDEVLIGLVIASNVKSGYSMIDITSDGINHYLRFENLSDGRPAYFQTYKSGRRSYSGKSARPCGKCYHRIWRKSKGSWKNLAGLQGRG